MPPSVIICLGDVARGDDGVAHRVAELLADALPHGARLLTSPRLDVAMADDLAEVDLVVFVRAHRREHPPVDVLPVEAEPHGEFGRPLAPGHLLDVAYALYASRPRAWLVSVAAPETEPGADLSEMAEEASLEAVSVIRELLG
jgi:hydrogenase maturation protease